MFFVLYFILRFPVVQGQCQTECLDCHYITQVGYCTIDTMIGFQGTIYPYWTSYCKHCPLGTFYDPSLYEYYVGMYYEPTYGLPTPCIPCPKNYYRYNLLDSSCTPCPLNYYSNPGSSECTRLECPYGTFVNTNDQTCTPCSPGKYSDSHTATFCEGCPRNTYAPVSGMSACLPCPTLSYSWLGQSQCTACVVQCPVDYYKEKKPLVHCNKLRTKLCIEEPYNSAGCVNIDDQVCAPCFTEGTCNTNSFITFRCPGTTGFKNQCRTCSSGDCPTGLYRQTCNSYQDSECTLPYTNCSSNFYLSSYSSTQNGICLECEDCGGITNTTIECSQYQKRICTGPCNISTACRSGVCVNNDVIIKSQTYTQTFCIPCPSGSTQSDNLCLVTTACAVGSYYNLIESQCKNCIIPSTGTSLVAVTPGLRAQNKQSCIYEPTIMSVGNQAGFYKSGSTQTQCNPGYTSEANNADSSTKCFRCPSDPVGFITYTQQEICNWVCINGYFSVGNKCLPNTEVDTCTMDGYTVQGTRCQMSPLPWQTRGYEYSTFTVSYSMSQYTFPMNTTYFPTFYSNVNNTVIRFTSRNTHLNIDFDRLDIGGVEYPVPGKVCSVAIMQGITYVVFCDISIIFYYSYATLLLPWRRLIGQNINGYQEGMKQDALFGKELYIGNANNNYLVVLDTVNCVVRQVVIGDNGPGDFRTKSYWIFGNRDCKTDLVSPRYLFTLQLPNMFAFLNNNFVVFLDAVTLKIAVSTFQVSGDILSIQSDPTGTRIYLGYTKSITTVVNQGSACKAAESDANITSCPDVLCQDDYTSQPGGGCSVYAPWNNGTYDGFYITDGIAYRCNPATCALGSVSSKCTRKSSAVCEACDLPRNLNIRLSTPNSCNFDIMPPCPLNMYYTTDACIQCPDIMITLFKGSKGLASCICGTPLVNTNGVCVLPSGTTFFPSFVQPACTSDKYQKSPTDTTCLNCVDTPCNLPQIGQYVASCSSTPQSCTNIPANAFATSPGLTGATSCTYQCNAGYYQKNGATTCTVCDVVPLPSNAYYYNLCDFDYYF